MGGNVERDKIVYDLLHGYHEGGTRTSIPDNFLTLSNNRHFQFSLIRIAVPFAVEEKSGTISVVDEMNRFDRNVYNFEATATNDKSLSLSTNVTIHVVDSDISGVSRYAKSFDRKPVLRTNT